MSKLAAALSDATLEPVARPLRGPIALCAGRYPADMDDWSEIDRMRHEGASWADVHQLVDQTLELTTRIPTDKFRYHWRRKCQCWPADLRNA